MKIMEISCKSALSKSGLGYDYALNPYRGCAHACTYCYAPDILRETRPWGQFVDIKRTIPSILAKELRRKSKGLVGIGTVTDGYQPVEQRYEVTRRCLEQLLRVDFPVTIQTKSVLVLRDLDLLQQFSQVDVGITLTTWNDHYQQVFEPQAAPIKDRLHALKQLNAHGIETWLFIGPILPQVTDYDLERLIKAAAQANVQEISMDRLRLKPGTWKTMLIGLKRDAPELIEPFKQALWGKTNCFKIIEDRIKDLCRNYKIPCIVAFES